MLSSWTQTATEPKKYALQEGRKPGNADRQGHRPERGLPRQAESHERQDQRPSSGLAPLGAGGAPASWLVRLQSTAGDRLSVVDVGVRGDRLWV